MIAYIALFFKEKCRVDLPLLSFRIAARYFVRLFGREQSDDNMNDVENEIVQVILSDEESYNSDNEDELNSVAAVSPNNVNTEAEEEDDVQIFQGKDGSC